MCSEFPHLVSYSRLVELLLAALLPLIVYLYARTCNCTGMTFIDSTVLAVCENPRIGQHKVLALGAARSKTSVGRFYGFKLYRMVNHRGELLAVC